MNVTETTFPNTTHVMVRESRVDNEYHSKNDKPAYETFNKQGGNILQQWYDNGLLHRVNGPAKVMYYNGKVMCEVYYWRDECIDALIKNGTIVLEEDGSIAEHMQFQLELMEIGHKQ